MYKHVKESENLKGRIHGKRNLQSTVTLYLGVVDRGIQRDTGQGETDQRQTERIVSWRVYPKQMINNYRQRLSDTR